MCRQSILSFDDKYLHPLSTSGMITQYDSEMLQLITDDTISPSVCITGASMLARDSWRLFVRAILFLAVFLLILLLSIFVVAYLSLRIAWPEWTGFDRSTITARIITTNIPQVPPELFIEYHQPEKTLWDWLGLLIVPSVLAFGAVYLTWQQRQNELEIAQKERQNELEIAQKERQNELEIAEPD